MIEILSLLRAHARKYYQIRMDSDTRSKFNDAQVVNIMDAGGDESQANVNNNFGGYVRPLGGDEYEVTVYTD